MKVGLPVFVASLPKSGTTMIWQYFSCGGRSASHRVKHNRTHSEQTGKCIRRNVDSDLAPFSGCGDYDVYTDTGIALVLEGAVLTNRRADCYFPSMQELDSIYQPYPTSTIVNIVRDATSWYKSMASWGNGSLQGSLLDRLMRCNITDLPRWGATETDFIQFYAWHTRQVREFALSHPSLTYVEVSLESPSAGKVLKEAIGIPASKCWGKCSPNSKFCDRLDQ
jgi:hypothetical protein